MIKKWVITKFTEWTQGQKHPSTPVTVFKNLYQQDLVRKILVARCSICNFVVSRDPMAVKELLYACEDKKCCAVGERLHQTCDICYWMFRALYQNFGLKDMQYFRKIDSKDREDRDDAARRRRVW